MMETDILKLGNELTIRRYLFDKLQFSNLLTAPDYIALYIINETSGQQNIYAGKTYLKDLAEQMQLSIRKTSKIVDRLNERGLVHWLHDGDGREGTYVTITEEGLDLLKKQQELIRIYYGKVIQKFGTENLVQLLNLMKQLETIMSSELEELEELEELDGDFTETE